MSGVHGDYDLGHTVAGWTGCALAVTGSAAVGASICAAWLPGVWLGTGVIAAAGLTTWVLHLMGWGKPSGPRPSQERDWRVRDPMTAHAGCLGCRLAGRRARHGTGQEAGRRTGQEAGAARDTREATAALLTSSG
ncbi:HGxxPAAW family protein [Planomonospora corallina]|uniref:HGxxPAAW family protein n=1 Tax=Planomonospora corallina TaxID=1806052 RepID=A0ABV8IGJ4_9ACTN